MKGKQTSVYIKWSRFENDWRIGFLEFIFWLLRFTRGGGSGGDTKGGIQSQWYHSKKYKWVEVTEHDESGVMS
jgi:hypothetical protein